MIAVQLRLSTTFGSASAPRGGVRGDWIGCLEDVLGVDFGDVLGMDLGVGNNSF